METFKSKIATTKLGARPTANRCVAVCRLTIGYTLTMVKRHAKCRAHDVTQLLSGLVPTLELISEAGDELCYRLPLAASPQLGPMLRHLDAVADTLGLSGYGMSLSSMEEVCLHPSALTLHPHPQPSFSLSPWP